MKTVLITGGAGFIGAHTVAFFLQKKWRVIVYDNFSSGQKSRLDLSHPHLKIVEGDLLDFPLLRETIAECDAVLHLAAIASVPVSLETPVHTLKTNLLGFVHILEAIRHAETPIRLVYASSAAVYGAASQLPCNDEAEMTDKVLSPYALEKLSNEAYADLYARTFQVKSLGLRYFNVYGPGQDPKSPYSGVISRFIEQYQRGGPITVWGDGKQTRDFIFIKDVVAANLKAIASDYVGVLNIATGQAQTLNQVIDSLQSMSGKKVPVEYAPKRAGDIYQSYAVVNKAQKAIGFKAETSLLEGIRELMLSYADSFP